MGIDAEMLVRTREPLTEQHTKTLAWEVAEAFGHDRFWIWDDPGNERRAIQRTYRYTQDGPDILPKTGETLLEISPATRYYGKGYERGDLPFLIMLAEWLERRIPGAEVWYGGDSSGICVTPFGKTEREELLAHFIEVGHTPYEGDPRIGTGWGRMENPRSVRCEFCDEWMTQNGWGGAFRQFTCPGCGLTKVSRDSGVTYKVTVEVGGHIVKESVPA